MARFITDLSGWKVGTEEFLGAVLESVAQPIWVVDPGGLIRFANRAAVDALGYDNALELLGRPSHETVHYRHPDGSPFPAAKCPMLLPRLTGETVSSELDWFIRRDGSMVPVSYVSAPIDMPDGRGAVVAFSDITERVQAEQILRERDAILASIRQPVWVIDHEGRIRFANPAALAVLGYDSLTQLEGRPAHAAVHHTRRDGSPYPVAECPLARCRAEGGTIDAGEDDWIPRDGSFVRIEYSCAPIDAPDGRGMVVAFTDVDERRRLERALRDRDIAQARAAELAAAGQRIIAAADAARRQVTRDLHDGAQQRFVNAVIKLQLGRSRLDEEPSKARDFVDAALAEAQAGLGELRELATGIHPSILTNRGLRPAVEELVVRSPLHIDLHCDITQRLPEPVEVSAYFFVSEALANAVKHADASQVTVSLVPEPDVVVVDVTDDGVGGVTLDPGSGTGLGGLADRVTALGGLLVVTSPPGEGTTLHAEIPLIADQAHPEPRRHLRPEEPNADGADTAGPPDDVPPLRVLRSGEGPVIEGGAISGTILGRFDTPCVFGELHAVPLPPGLRQVSGAHPGGVRELVHVHRGMVRIGPVTGPVELHPGDFADYAADVPHLYEVVGDDALMTVLMLRFGEQGPLP